MNTTHLELRRIGPNTVIPPRPRANSFRTRQDMFSSWAPPTATAAGHRAPTRSLRRICVRSTLGTPWLVAEDSASHDRNPGSDDVTWASGGAPMHRQQVGAVEQG